MVTNIELCTLLKEHRDVDTCVSALIGKAMEQVDVTINITVILYRIAKTEQANILAQRNSFIKYSLSANDTIRDKND